MDKLTPTLNDIQIKQNIDALQKQGVSNDKIQSYVNNYQKGTDGNYVLKGSQAPKLNADAIYSGLAVKGSVPQSDTAPFPATPAGNGNMGIVDTAKIVPNAVKDAASLAKEGTLGTAKRVLYDIPKEAINLIGEQGVGNAIKNTILSAPEALVKTAWGLVPQSAKELANTHALSEIPSQFQALAKEKGGYAKAFVDMVKSIPDSVTPALKDYADQIDRARQSFENHPLNELLGYTGLKSLVENPAGTAKSTTDALKTTADFTKSPLRSLGDIGSEIKNGVKGQVFGLPEEQIKNTTSEWQKPAVTAKPSFYKASEVLKKSPDTPKFLAEQGLDPQAHIEDGNYNTAGTAESLRNTAKTLSNETLRPSLQQADYSTPRTSVEDIQTRAISIANGTKGITAGSRGTIIENIKSEISALKAKYPQGMSLEDLHDNKIDYAQNAGYSPVNDPAVNNTATANRSTASALQKILEEKAPADVPVKEFNAYLQKYYQGADYLESLNNKKAPVSVGQKIVRGAAKATGAVIGAHVGGLPTEFAGYSIGGALEHAVENMPNPVRTEFLKNLQTTNPPAFDKIINYLGQQKAQELTQLKLPAPSATMKSGGKEIPVTAINPIPLKAPVGKSGIEVISATKNPVSANPKTGKFQTTYSSTPKR